MVLPNTSHLLGYTCTTPAAQGLYANDSGSGASVGAVPQWDSASAGRMSKRGATSRTCRAQCTSRENNCTSYCLDEEAGKIAEEEAVHAVLVKKTRCAVCRQTPVGALIRDVVRKAGMDAKSTSRWETQLHNQAAEHAQTVQGRLKVVHRRLEGLQRGRHSVHRHCW